MRRLLPLVSRCAGDAGRYALALALCASWLVGAGPASWALLGPAQKTEPAALLAPGSPLLVGTDSPSDTDRWLPPPMNLSAFPWGRGYSRMGLMSDSAEPVSGRQWPTATERSAAVGAQALLLSFGSGTTLKAGLNQQENGRGTPQDERTEERKLEFSTKFGGGDASGLRLAMTSVETMKGGESSGARTAEAHLSLAPAARMTVGADYVAKSSDGGQSQATQVVRTALRLAPETELSASMKRSDASGASATSESQVALSASLGFGKLQGEEKWSRTGGSRVASRAWAFSGGLGEGAARTKLALDLRESRGARPEDQSTRKAVARVQRALGPHMNLSAEYRENVAGTGLAPERQTETEYGLEATLGPETTMSAALIAGSNARGDSVGRRRLRLAHTWRGMRLKVDERAWQEGLVARSLLGWSAEAPQAELPGWAKTLRTGHQFADANEYLLGGVASWQPPEVPFVGSRLWGMQRAADDGGASSSLGFAHRRVVAGHYDLQLALEDRPEAEPGQAQWQSHPVRRSSLAIGRQLSSSLNARGGFGLESSLDSPDDRLSRMGVAVWGVLPDGKQIEGAVSRESGRWEGEARSRTEVSLLYAHAIDEEHRVEVKLGYAWAAGAESGSERNTRLTLAYENPL